MPENGIANPTAPTFEVELDRKRRLKFDWNSVCAIEDVTKKNMLQKKNWDAIFGNMDASNVRLLLWAALVWEDPELALADVGRMLSKKGQAGVPNIIEALNRAIEAHTLRAEAEDERPLAEGAKVPAPMAT